MVESVPTLCSSKRAQDSDEKSLVQQQVKTSHSDPEQQHTHSHDADTGRETQKLVCVCVRVCVCVCLCCLSRISILLCACHLMYWKKLLVCVCMLFIHVRFCETCALWGCLGLSPSVWIFVSILHVCLLSLALEKSWFCVCSNQWRC